MAIIQSPVVLEETRSHFIRFGSRMGSRCSFSSSSSIKLIFHWRRCSCHVPKANVKIGMKPKSKIVGLDQDDFFAA